MDSGIEWRVPCRNLDRHRRTLLVLAEMDTGAVILMMPTGEAAVLTPLQVGRLRDCLRQAIIALGWIEDRSDGFF